MMVYLYFMPVGILSACIHIHLVHAVPPEDSRGHWIPWTGIQTVISSVGTKD